MSDSALVILADNMNRLINREGGAYSSNEAAQKGSQGKVSRSTFDRLRNLDKVGATSVGIDKLDGVAKTFGVQVWQLFTPRLDINSPPKLVPADQGEVKWPFKLVDVNKLAGLAPSDLERIEGAILLAAAQLSVDVKK